jgi:hypothetical protein
MINPESRLGKMMNGEIRHYGLVPPSMLLTCLTVLAVGGGLKDVVTSSIAVGSFVALIITGRLGYLEEKKAQSSVSPR